MPPVATSTTHLVVALAVAATVAAAVFALTRRLTTGTRLTERRALAVQAAAATLAAVVTGELTVGEVGEWWASHPTTGAVFTGALVTVIVLVLVEARFQQEVERAEQRRWHAAGRAAVEALLLAVADPLRRYQARGIWVEEGSAGGPSPEEILRGPVLSAAPVLTATGPLHGIYDDALEALRLARGFTQQMQRHRDQTALPEDAYPSQWEGRRLDWWGVVVADWEPLLYRLHALHAAATELLGVEEDLDEYEPEPWNHPPPREFMEGLADYMEEFGRYAFEDVHRIG